MSNMKVKLYLILTVILTAASVFFALYTINKPQSIDNIDCDFYDITFVYITYIKNDERLYSTVTDEKIIRDLCEKLNSLSVRKITKKEYEHSSSPENGINLQFSSTALPLNELDLSEAIDWEISVKENRLYDSRTGLHYKSADKGYEIEENILEYLNQVVSWGDEGHTEFLYKNHGHTNGG